MGRTSKKRYKRKRRGNNTEQLDLETKVADAGGQAYFGLEASSSGDENEDPNDSNHQSGVYGSRRSVASRSITTRSSRRFSKKPASSMSHAPSMGQASTASTTRNPYKSTRVRRSSKIESSVRSASGSRHSRSVLQKPAVHIVCAIGENLARETCISSLDAGTPVCLQVTKQGNGQTYAETLAYLEMLGPDEVLLNDGRRNSPLARKILQLYGGNSQDRSSTKGGGGDGGNQTSSSSGPCKMSTVVKFISRSCFDQTKGAELLRRLTRKETYDVSLVEEYILLSSSYAVLHYTQQTLGSSFSKNCLDVSINSGGENRMSIDRSTLLQLELLTNAKTGKTKNSLISTIDCTKTTVGSRLLRTNLMAPPCRIDTINARLGLVDTFLEDEDFFYAVLEHLQSLPAVDKMLTNIAVIPRRAWKAKTGKNDQADTVATARMASKGVSALVCIKSTLAALPALTTTLKDHLTQLKSGDGHTNESSNDDMTAMTGRSTLLVGLGGGPASTAMPRRHYLLRAIIHACSQPELNEVCGKVSDLFTESTTFSRNANAMRHQECFALKSADNGMMDVIRRAFLANVDDIYKKADEYAEIHGIHVSVRYSVSRGYYLSIPANVSSDLPNVFLQPSKAGNYIHCSTEEVLSLNIRAQDNVHDLLLMTHERITEGLDFARSKYDALASLSDAVALLDLCHSFADKVTLSRLPWSRPLVSDDYRETSDSGSISISGGIMIRNGRYCIDVTDSYLAAADGPQDVVPNDTYATGEKSFTVISGINGSGKSTYLKQIGIIVLLAHCGSYVPAEQASIPLRTRLCARMGTSDDQENNISSFMLEMKETAFICNNASAGSLILLDELGRATSNEDGVSIAWAVSEFLLAKKSMTFFVTHYPQLCRLSNVYPAIQNQHLKSSVSGERDGGINYTHKVTPGPCTSAPDYGVEMASSCGWPLDVVDDARRIEPGLRDKLVQGDFCAGNQPSFLKKNTLKQISHALIEIVQSEASIDSLCSRLQELRTSPVVNSELENFNNLLGGKISMTASGKDTNPSTQEESRSIITGKAGTSDQQPGPKYFTRLSRDDDREENSSLSSFDSSISESSVSGSSDSVRNSEGGHVEVTTVTSTDETIL